jgi:hypothetical protein
VEKFPECHSKLDESEGRSRIPELHKEGIVCILKNTKNDSELWVHSEG